MVLGYLRVAMCCLVGFFNGFWWVAIAIVVVDVG